MTSTSSGSSTASGSGSAWRPQQRSPHRELQLLKAQIERSSADLCLANMDNLKEFVGNEPEGQEGNERMTVVKAMMERALSEEEESRSCSWEDFFRKGPGCGFVGRFRRLRDDLGSTAAAAAAQRVAA